MKTPGSPAGLLRHKAFLPSLIVLAAAALWLPGLLSPFWRDETITWWIIRDGWKETFSRALEFQEWSAAYFIFLKGWSGLFGKSEFSLRLPSVLAGAASLRAVYLLGKRLKDAETGFLAALVLAASGSLAFHAADARPYSMALAFGLLSTSALAALLEENKPRDAAAFALCAALAVYFHLAFAGLLWVQALYGAYRCLREKRPAGKFLAALCLLFAFLVPLAWPAARILARSDSLMYEGAPRLGDLFRAILPFELGVCLAAAFFASSGLKDFGGALKKIPVSALILAGALAALPPLIFFALSGPFSLNIWVFRYFMYSLAGTALCAGLFLSALEPPAARRAAAALIVAFSIVKNGRLSHADEDWRAAAVTAGAYAAAYKVPVLLLSPFVESGLAAWLSDPERAGYLSAPVSVYPVNAPVTVLPGVLTGRNESASRVAVENITRAGRGVVVIGAADAGYTDWLGARFLEKNFVRHGYRSYGCVSARVFLKKE